MVFKVVFLYLCLFSVGYAVLPSSYLVQKSVEGKSTWENTSFYFEVSDSSKKNTFFEKITLQNGKILQEVSDHNNGPILSKKLLKWTSSGSSDEEQMAKAILGLLFQGQRDFVEQTLIAAKIPIKTHLELKAFPVKERLRQEEIQIRRLSEGLTDLSFEVGSMQRDTNLWYVDKKTLWTRGFFEVKDKKIKNKVFFNNYIKIKNAWLPQEVVFYDDLVEKIKVKFLKFEMYKNKIDSEVEFEKNISWGEGFDFLMKKMR